VVCAKVERQTKLRFDIVESFDKPIGDFSMQELDTAVACRTIAVQPPGAPIEQHQWEIVGSGHRGEVAGLG
jgi:dihydroneopterin aldolase